MWGEGTQEEGPGENMQITSAQSLHFLTSLAEVTEVWEGLSLETEEG